MFNKMNLNDEIFLLKQICLSVWCDALALAGVVARVVVEPSRDIESLRGRMGESARQVKGLFESLLSQSFSSEL